jgi:hypothetical protein
MTLPCSVSDGLPIDLQLIDSRFEEATFYRRACSFEQAIDWRQRCTHMLTLADLGQVTRRLIPPVAIESGEATRPSAQ